MPRSRSRRARVQARQGTSPAVTTRRPTTPIGRSATCSWCWSNGRGRRTRCASCRQLQLKPLRLWPKGKLRLKEVVSRERFVVAGNPDYILHRDTDLPHRVVLTLHVQSRLHQRLSSARNAFLQALECRVVDHRTDFHLSVDNVWWPFQPLGA